MDDEHYQLIKRKYENIGEDFSELFQAILSIADEIGLDEALNRLEECVAEKRQLWLCENFDALEKTGNPIEDAYRIFYGVYLGVSTPKGEEIVQKTERKLVMRWRNPCPVLEACKELGLDTREICAKVYHRPVQVFLSRINPKLRFDRNYNCIRPYTSYCEEIVTLGE